MARPRTIPDTDVFAIVRQLLAEGGDKAVAFSAVAQASGLAAPSLVQRYGSREGMVRAALTAGWDAADAAAEEAALDTPPSAKGALAFLKVLGAQTADLALLATEFRDPALRARASAWRAQVEAVLAQRLGGGARGREAAALLFAAWQGQVLWQATGGKGFRLKDVVKRLG
ncbi:transcriptional regulator [Paracoccaceae bacterium Fryx2]|nr:transcriptional regulator [Paracoccaceae bacterium Fryx2]